MRKILSIFALSFTLLSCSSVVKEIVSAPDIKAIRLVDFSLSKKQVIFDVDLYNPNAFTLPISGISGNFRINNLTIGNLKASSKENLTAYSTQTVRLPINLNTDRLIDATQNVLIQQQALYDFDGKVDTSIGKVPFSKSGELSVKEIISGLLQ